MEEVDRRRIAVWVAVAVVVCVLGARYLRAQGMLPAGDEAVPAAEVQKPAGARAGSGDGVQVGRAPGDLLVVHVAGHVRRPGVLRLREGARVDEAVRQAGGAKPGADLSLVNLAAKVEDGRQVLVPKRGAVAAAPASGGSAGGGGPAGPGTATGGPAAAPVNLNTATAEQLDTLDGVGPGIAGKILAYRDEHGGFGSVDELAQVPGIGPKRMQALRELVTV